jgi:polyferredoxin
LVRRLLPWQVRLPTWVASSLKALPTLLLLWVLVVAIRDWSFSLNSVEPFDAYVFRIAGWGTIAVAVLGLIASLFIPRAYCHFGCPTGALLNYVRLRGAADRFTWRDAIPLVFLALAWLLGRG